MFIGIAVPISIIITLTMIAAIIFSLIAIDVIITINNIIILTNCNYSTMLPIPDVDVHPDDEVAAHMYTTSLPTAARKAVFMPRLLVAVLSTRRLLFVSKLLPISIFRSHAVELD